MNADNTFNKLRRTPISQLDGEYRERMWEFYSNHKVYREWLEKHGWTNESFVNAGVEYEHNLRQLTSLTK